MLPAIRPSGATSSARSAKTSSAPVLATITSANGKIWRMSIRRAVRTSTSDEVTPPTTEVAPATGVSCTAVRTGPATSLMAVIEYGFWSRSTLITT